MTTSDQSEVHPRSLTELAERARFVRLETLRLSRIAGAGHYSSTFSAAELLVTLYYAHLRIDPASPTWPERDRFVLSKGHVPADWVALQAATPHAVAEAVMRSVRFARSLGGVPGLAA